MLDYAERNDQCRSQILLDYFGETGSQPCGECDVCHSRKEEGNKNPNETGPEEKIMQGLAGGPCTLDELSVRINLGPEKFTDVLRRMIDNRRVLLSEDGILSLGNIHPG
jgi:ATP-dependent DNA helicase RecQ